MGAEGDGGAPQPWERLSSREVAAYEMFRVREDRERSPKDGKEHTYHAAVSPGGVVIVAVTADGRVVMVEQYRHGARRVTLELPSGVIGDGESPADAARRELREETGYQGDAPQLLGCIDLNPSWQVTHVHAALVRHAHRAGEQDEDPGEDIRVRLVSADDLRRKLVSGEVNAGSVVSALALWDWKERGLSGPG